METATFLVRKKGLDAEALFLQATRFLCGGHLADHIQRLVIPLGPTTPHHDGTIRFSCVVDLFSLDQPPRLETRAKRLQAEGFARPRRHGPCGGATRIGPARLLARVLELRPIACAIAQQHDLRPRGDQRADEGDQGDMKLFRKGPFRGVAHPPGQREGTTFLNDMDHQRGTPAAYAAAIHDELHRLQGEVTQQDVRIGQQVHLLQDVGVVEPPRKAFDAAFRFGTVGHFRRDVRQLGALAAHDPADERRQGAQVPSDRAGRLARIPLCQGIPYGTLPAEVVTHRLLLLDWLCSPERVYDGATS
jgi:hypothetical protein